MILEVQYRDKTSSTEHLVATAKRLHAVTQRYKVPLLVNDRIDVALAVGCEGVHIGQDDLGVCSLAVTSPGISRVCDDTTMVTACLVLDFNIHSIRGNISYS